MEENRDKLQLIRTKRDTKRKKQFLFLLIVVIGIVLLDQLLKLMVQNFNEIVVIENVLQFKIQENVNPAYGIGDNSTFMYVVSNLIIFSVIFKIITSDNQFVNNRIRLCLTFVLAGGISNLIDRVFRGFVMEFVDFTPLVSVPVFNLADVFIFIGWIWFAWIFAVFTVKEWKETSKKIINK